MSSSSSSSSSSQSQGSSGFYPGSANQTMNMPTSQPSSHQSVDLWWYLLNPNEKVPQHLLNWSSNNLLDEYHEHLESWKDIEARAFVLGRSPIRADFKGPDPRFATQLKFVHFAPAGQELHNLGVLHCVDKSIAVQASANPLLKGDRDVMIAEYGVPQQTANAIVMNSTVWVDFVSVDGPWDWSTSDPKSYRAARKMTDPLVAPYMRDLLKIFPNIRTVTFYGAEPHEFGTKHLSQLFNDQV